MSISGIWFLCILFFLVSFLFSILVLMVPFLYGASGVLPAGLRVHKDPSKQYLGLSTANPLQTQWLNTKAWRSAAPLVQLWRKAPGITRARQDSLRQEMNVVSGSKIRASTLVLQTISQAPFLASIKWPYITKIAFENNKMKTREMKVWQHYIRTLTVLQASGARHSLGSWRGGWNPWHKHPGEAVVS